MAQWVFWRQFSALFIKNLIVIRKHWLVNILRCLLFPLGYGIFLAFANDFFKRPNNAGLGTTSPIFSLEDHFDGSKPLVWADNTNGTGYISGKDIMNHVVTNFSSKQRAGIYEASSSGLNKICVMNFSGGSSCYIAVTFDSIPPTSSNGSLGVQYTIRSDEGIYQVDVFRHTSALETKAIPLQWAIDNAIIELSTNQQFPKPTQLPFTHFLSDEAYQDTRLEFLSILGGFGGIAFFLAFTGITYQLAGGVALERASHLTSHLQAMGALDSARIISWHLSVSSLYLPVWIILAIIWRVRLFHATNVGLVILIHLLTGLGLASWSFFVCVPFSKSPQLAAVVTTGLAVALGVVPMMLFNIGSTTPTILSFFFPSMFYILSLKYLAGYELWRAIEEDQRGLLSENTGGILLLPMIIATLFSIFVWPLLAIVWERLLYRISNPSNSKFWRKNEVTGVRIPPEVAVSIRNIQKTFNPSFFRRKSSHVVAIADLTIDIPSYGITVLLGPNGAGKSTTLAILAGLTRASAGSLVFEGNTSRPPRGTLGIVPQKNVLFPELSCLQTLRVWRAVKSVSESESNRELEQLILDCDLASKMHEPAGTLSGGQKRKLQLAIGLVGGSKIILVDECTSGVDPLSRRALWKTLTTYRNDRTIILTTHFLDEADFLADRIAVLASPGKLIASDTPVALKSTMGEGYSVSVKFKSDRHSGDLLNMIQTVTHDATLSPTDTSSFIYHLKSRDTAIVGQALRLVEDSKHQFDILSYDVLGTTIEDIFLDLLAIEDKEAEEKSDTLPVEKPSFSDLVLSDGRTRTPWAQATTIFYKRALISRRSWLAPLLAMAVGISGAWWPIRFVKGGVVSCTHFDNNLYDDILYPPLLFGNDAVVASPPSLIPFANATLPELFVSQVSPGNALFAPFRPVDDQKALIETINQNFRNFSISGGLSMDFEQQEILVAYQMSTSGLEMFNLVSNLYFEHAKNISNRTPPANRIITSIGTLPKMSSESLATLQWLAIFGAAMAVYPAFFAIYTAKERHSSVQAMHLSNGLANPLGLWLGHLMFDSMFTVIIATAIVIVYTVVRDKFQGIGFLWLVICLYGFAGTLLAYITSTIIKSPLGAFAALVVSQFIIFLLYLTGYIVTFFSTLQADVPHVMNTIALTMALVSPISSLTRAAMVSVNQFSILCEGDRVVTGAGLGGIHRYGGPILFLILWIIFLLFVLSQIDAGFRLPWSRSTKKLLRPAGDLEKLDYALKTMNPDVLAEVEHANSPSTTDPLRVLNISKLFGSNKVVDNVSFTIPKNSLFVMLGPNGAGKTTTFDIIRGHLSPDAGDVKVNDTSVLLNMKKARVSFGVCPQFTAMDAHLTVREHLFIYGRLRGLEGEQLQSDINSLMAAAGLDSYANRLATKLSGGNQRKLTLAIALIGNPPVILVDEYSTGIDAKMKRELWAVLKYITAEKSVFLTTHSMEEASYLATKVGILSKRMLAVGTPDELESRNASYEVHFSCPSKDEMLRVHTAMGHIPGARMVDDVATRFEVPIGMNAQGGVTSVADIFEILSREKEFPEFTVGKSTLETAFIKIINEDVASDAYHEKVPIGKRFWGLC